MHQTEFQLFFSLGKRARWNQMLKLEDENIHHYNVVSRIKTNFESVLKNMWKWRGLTLLGRIKLVKSFI